MKKREEGGVESFEQATSGQASMDGLSWRQKLLQRKRARVKRIDKLMTMEDKDKPALEIEKKDCNARSKALMAVHETYSKKIWDEDKALAEVKNKLNGKTKGRRSSESSVYNEVDRS